MCLMGGYTYTGTVLMSIHGGWQCLAQRVARRDLHVLPSDKTKPQGDNLNRNFIQKHWIILSGGWYRKKIQVFIIPFVFYILELRDKSVDVGQEKAVNVAQTLFSINKIICILVLSLSLSLRLIPLKVICFGTNEVEKWLLVCMTEYILHKSNTTLSQSS